MSRRALSLRRRLMIAFALFTLYGCGPEPVLYGTMLLMLGIPVYIWQRHRAPASHN